MQKSDFIEFLGLVSDSQEILDDLIVDVASSFSVKPSQAEKAASKINNLGPSGQLDFLIENGYNIEEVCFRIIRLSESVPNGYKDVVDAAYGIIKAYKRDLFIHDLVGLSGHGGAFLYFCRDSGSNIFKLGNKAVGLSEFDKEVVASFVKSNEHYFHWDGVDLNMVPRRFIEEMLSR